MHMHARTDPLENRIITTSYNKKNLFSEVVWGEFLASSIIFHLYFFAVGGHFVLAQPEISQRARELGWMWHIT